MKIPRVFLKPDNQDSKEVASGDDPQDTPLETIDITLKGGAEVKLYLNKLAASGKLR